MAEPGTRDLRIVPIRSITGAEVAAALLDAIWGGVNVTPEVIRAVSHAGGYAVLAFVGDESAPIAASMGWLGQRQGLRLLHSHITGVRPTAQGRHVGFEVKLHQRRWAAEQGLDVIEWTFDPLVRRNAWFNIARLGAGIVAYEEAFYGSAMSDAINGREPADRLVVRWPARGPLGPGPVVPDPGDVVAETPADIVSLRQQDSATALEWRLRLRAELGGAMAQGLRIRGVTATGGYVLAAPAAGRPSGADSRAGDAGAAPGAGTT